MKKEKLIKMEEELSNAKIKKMKKEELIKVEEELSNEKLAQIIGGVSSSKISGNDQHGISTRIV